MQRYAPNADMDLVERAYRYADEKHKSQLRKSGEPYIIHPLAVAEIVAEMGLDTDAIAAALQFFPVIMWIIAEIKLKKYGNKIVNKADNKP